MERAETSQIKEYRNLYKKIVIHSEMSLKQKLLKTIATGLTLTALSGIPAYASHNDSKSNFENNTYEFGDVDEDGLTDMIVGNNSAVIYFRNAGNRRFEYKQKIYTPKNKEKPMITLVTINGKLNCLLTNFNNGLCRFKLIFGIYTVGIVESLFSLKNK